MRVYIQVKQLGKRKCCIEKLPVDFSVPPTNVPGVDCKYCQLASKQI